MNNWLNKNFTFIGAALSIFLFVIWILISGCTTALPGTKDIYGRKYQVPITIIAPEVLWKGTSNYQ